MVSVGCDFGLRKSGVVVIDEDFEIQSQNLIRIPEPIKGAERLVSIEKGFNEVLGPYIEKNLECFVEGYAYGAKYQRESLAELGGVIRRYLFLADINFWVIPPTALKLYVTGNGKATKNYMKKCTKDRWNQNFKSDDVCDAYGMARLGMTVMKKVRSINGLHLNEKAKTIVEDIVENQDFYKNSNTARKKHVKRKRKTQS